MLLFFWKNHLFKMTDDMTDGFNSSFMARRLDHSRLCVIYDPVASLVDKTSLNKNA